jgi:predicted ATPase
VFKEVRLKVGAGVASPPLRFDPGPMTVFVGPNNSGKSLILQEIPNYVGRGGGYHLRLIDHLLWKEIGLDEARKLLLSLKMEDAAPPPTEEGIYIQLGGSPLSIHLENTAELLSRAGDLEFLRQLFSEYSLLLDGQARLQLAQGYSTGGGLPSRHPILRLFHDKASRARLREDVRDALGLYYTISPLNIGSLAPALAESTPKSPDEDEWALDERGKRFFARATGIHEYGDGIKAFIGIMSSVISSDYKVILIDEPEAFLHPPLVRRLGKRLAELAAERGGNIFASTHSPDFIMGCIQSGKRANIVRLTYKRGVATAKILHADDLMTMMRDPLLRATGCSARYFTKGR